MTGVCRRTYKKKRFKRLARVTYELGIPIDHTGPCILTSVGYSGSQLMCRALTRAGRVGLRKRLADVLEEKRFVIGP